MTVRAVSRFLLIGAAITATAAMCLLALEPVQAPSWTPPQNPSVSSGDTTP